MGGGAGAVTHRIPVNAGEYVLMGFAALHPSYVFLRLVLRGVRTLVLYHRMLVHVR